MEEEAPCANKHISNKSHEEDIIVAMPDAAYDALDSKVNEDQVGESVDNLCRVSRCIVILWIVRFILLCPTIHAPLHTNSRWMSPVPSNLFEREDSVLMEAMKALLRSVGFLVVEQNLHEVLL